jgi:predicted nucleic acid-binding protein
MLAMPGLVLHDLDAGGAVDAAAVASSTFIRGADAVYLACALATRSTLVTLDLEQLDRAPAGVTVTSPAAWPAGKEA